MNKITKVLITSLLTAALCVSLIAGATFALFTSESNIDIAVTSGKVAVTASVKALALSSNAETDDFDWVDATDIVAGVAGSAKGTFADGGTATYLPNDGAGELTIERIMPGDAVKLTLGVDNGSTVAIKYQVRIIAQSDSFVGAEGEVDPAPEATLSSALELIFNGSTSSAAFAASAWQAVAPGAAIDDQEVIIRLPKDVGNPYQSKACDIALTVLAIQGNARETSYCDEHGHNIVDDVCTRCGYENPFKAAELHEVDSEGNYVVKGAPAGLTELEVPYIINGQPVKLAAGAFEGNTDLVSVVLDEGFTELVTPTNSPLKWGAFTRCTNLVSVKLPSTLTKINRYSFYQCSNLKEVNIPDSVTFIGDKAFCETALESVDLPEGLETIDREAFEATKLTHIEIPDSVTSVGYSVFASCLQLESAKIGNGLTTITGDDKGNHPAGVFYNCPNLLSVEIGSSVTSVGLNAFKYCYRLAEVRNHSAMTILTKAEGAEEYTVGYNAIEILTGSDADSTRITSDGDYRFYTAKDGGKYLVGYAGAGGALVLPDSGEQYEIYNYAFYKNLTVTDVKFGNSATAIGEYAFAETDPGTSYYYDLTIAGGITAIRAHAFDKAFSSHYVTVYIGDDVTEIGDEAFANCSLYEVCIGTPHSRYDSTQKNSKLAVIGNGAFKGCTVNYAGGFRFRNTSAKWLELAEGKNVFESVKSITVQCSDRKLKYSNGTLTE